MKLKVFFVILFLLFTKYPAFAEEIVQAEPTAEVVVEEPAYTPPPEALEGVGGWAVVDPNTGNVHGVIVCTNDVCGPNGEWGGRMPIDYMGCSGCNLRFQTKPSENGNVGGWRSQEDKTVTYNSSDDSFDIQSESVTENGGAVKKKQKIKAGKVDSDSNGIEDVSTEYNNNLKEESVKVIVDESVEEKPVVIEYKEWKRFDYPSTGTFVSNIESDIEEVLVAEQEIVDEGNGVVVESSFATTIKELTTRVKNFISSIFGG